MWSLLVRIPNQVPEEILLNPGGSTIGRVDDNAVVLVDKAASRFHAEITYREGDETLTIRDLNSTNGTCVNRERIDQETRLNHGDTIRIGGTTIDVIGKIEGGMPRAIYGTQQFTRELVLESVDHHAVLMYEVARELNLVTNIDTALKKVSGLMKNAMGADRCEVILAEHFEKLAELKFPSSIAETAIQQRSTIVVHEMDTNDFKKKSGSSILLRIQSALCVPVMADEEVIALVYMYKVKGNFRPFSQRDVQLAVAISHQAALTIQRMHLLEQIQAEQRALELFQRFVSPTEAEYMARDYLKDGYLPGLMEKSVTIMFADIAGSTTLAEKIGPQKFSEILNRFYWDVTGTVFGKGGLVKYLGDGIMAVFGMAAESKGSAERKQEIVGAVKSALSLLDHIETTDYGEEIIIGVGMNTGMAMIGYVGTQERVEVTAVGDVANVAFRLQDLARPNRLFVGPETAFEIAGKFPLADLGLQEVHGRVHKIRVYEVLRKRIKSS